MNITSTKTLAVSSAVGLTSLTLVQLAAFPAVFSALAAPMAPVIPVIAFIGLWAVQAAIVLAVAALALRAFATSPTITIQPTEDEALQISLQTSEPADTSEIFETQTA